MNQQLLRILLIDTEDMSRQSLAAFLAVDYSYVVDTAVNIEQAWTCVTQAQEPYHAVLIDIALPPKTADASEAPQPGLELMRRIQARSPRTSFILLRDPSVNFSLDEALNAGAFRYLDKTFPYHEFAILLRHAANHYQYQEVTREQSLLEHVVKAQSDSLGLQNVREALMPLMQGVQRLHFDRVRMYLLSNDGRCMVSRLHVGMGPNFEGQRFEVMEDIEFQRKLKNPRPMILTRPPGESVPCEALLSQNDVDQWVTVPLVERGGRILGVLEADNKVSRRPILETELEPVGLLARQIASTIAHGRLYAETERRAEQLDTLRRTTLDITSERDHSVLLRKIVERAVLLLSAQGGGLYTYHPTQELLTLVVDHNRPGPDLEGRELRVGEGIVGQLVQEGVPFKIVGNYPEWQHRVWPDRPHMWGTVLAVPLKWHDEITGVLFIGDDVERKFRGDDVRLLRMFADQAAISLVNMERAQQDAAKMTRLEQVAQATRMITDKLDEISLDERLLRVVRHMVDILGAEAASVYTQPSSGGLHLAAGYRCDQVEVEPSQYTTLEASSGAELVRQLMPTEAIFNGHGDVLQQHPLLAQIPSHHLLSGNRHALLIVPLKHHERGSETLFGFLIAENKKDWDGWARPGVGFTAEDEWIATIFAETTVTAMKNAKLVQELVTQREHWQRLVTSASHGIVALDRHGAVTDHNPQANHILGYSSRDIFPSHVKELYMDPNESHMVGDHLSRSPSGLLTHYLTDLQSKTGQRIPVRMSATLLYDDQKCVVGSVSYFEDLRTHEEEERQRDLLLHAIRTVIHPENPLEGLQKLTDWLVELLERNFCRILLMDEGGMGLTVKAASAGPYLDAPLAWNPSLEQTALLARWPGLEELLQGESTVLRINNPRYQGGLRRFSKELELPMDVQSLLMVPLKREKELVGLLQLGELSTKLFTTDQIRLVSMIAAQCTVAIQAIRFYERNQVARQRLRSLLASSNELVSAHAPKDVLSNVLKHIRVATGATWVRVLLIDDSGRAWHQMIEGIANPPALEGAVRPDGISRTVMQTGQAIPIEDTRKPEPGKLHPILLAGDIQAALCLPFSAHGKCIGVMWLNYGEPRTFADAEIKDVQLYVNQAAIAHENAHRLDILAQVRQAAAELAEATTLDELLPRITWRARSVFRADSAAIFMYDVDKQHLVLRHIADSQAHTPLEDRANQDQSPWRRLAESIEQEQWLSMPHVGNQEVWSQASMRYAFGPLGIQSWQASLLRVGRDRLGILFVHYLQLRQFDESDREIMTMFAHYAALELKKVKLLDQRRTTVWAAEHAARALTSGNRVDTLRAIAHGTWRGVGCDGVTLYVYDQLRSADDDPVTITCIRHDVHRGWSESAVTEDQVASLFALDRIQAVSHVASDPLFQMLPIQQGDPSESCVVFPLSVAEQKVGVMLVGYQVPRRFMPYQIEEMKLFVDQAAVGIHHDLLLKQVNKRAGNLETLYRAGQAVTSSLERDEILQHIAVQAWGLTQTHSALGGYADIWLRDDHDEERVRIVAAYPSDKLHAIRAALPHGIDINPLHGEHIGVIGRAIQEGATQLVRNVEADPDYVRSHERILSELVVPIRIGGKIIGAINVEHPAAGAFHDDVKQVLEALADQAGIAIRNARQFEELKQSRGIIGTRTAVAWMGMTSAAWRHTIGMHATTIQDRLQLLRDGLSANGSMEALEEHLRVIDQMATSIHNTPITAPLQPDGGGESFDVKEIIQERIKQLQERNEGFEFVVSLDAEASLLVCASAQWFKQALDILIDNALEAMHDQSEKKLTVATRLVDNKVEIVVDDVGQGIPAEILDRLLQEPIAKLKDSKGSGVGLLLARTIIQTYGGDIRLERTSPNGTTMIMWLPLETSSLPEEVSSGAPEILLVCDQQQRATLKEFQNLLSQLADVITVTEDEALVNVIHKTYDLIVIDAVSIREPANFIRQLLDRQASAKVIVTTSSPDWREARKVIQAGANDYIDKSDKSLAAKKLIGAFERILENQYAVNK